MTTLITLPHYSDYVKQVVNIAKVFFMTCKQPFNPRSLATLTLYASDSAMSIYVPLTCHTRPVVVSAVKDS